MTEIEVVMSTRPSWDDTWMRVAWDVSERSRCVRDKVGAVIVDASNRIVATGYNGPPAGFGSSLAEVIHQIVQDPHPETTCDTFCERGMHGPASPHSYGDCVALHAEANAIAFCDRREREGGTIYVTGPVCWDCAKLIANSGLTRAAVLSDAIRAYREPERSYDLMRRCGLAVEEIGDRRDVTGWGGADDHPDE